MSVLTTLGTMLGEVGRSVTRSIGDRMRHKYIAATFRNHPAAVTQSLPFDWSGKPNRIALVNLLLHDRVGGDYLEIGCDTDALFDSVAVAHKVGVDPNRGGNVRLESDQFFAEQTQRFDVIWIDGLHTYDQVRRDVVNSIRALKPGGWIGLHDLLPRTWTEGFVPRLFPDGAWSGDVWKVAFELADSPDIDFRIIDIDRGVGVFRLARPGAQLADMRSQLAPATFAYLHANIRRLPVIGWADAFTWILEEKRKQKDNQA